MLHVGKCPKCEKVLDHINLESIEVGFEPRWRGLSYLCPFCHTVLSVGIDPFSLENDIVDRILEKVPHK